MVNKSFVVVIDKQEKTPLEFPSREVTTVSESLDTGDYAIKVDNLLAPIRVERKGSDLFSSFSGDNYRRERDKIRRAHEIGCRYVIAIEQPCSGVRLGHRYYKAGAWHDSGKDGLTQVRQLERISQKYKVELRYCKDRADMAFMIQELLLTYCRHDDWTQDQAHCP